MRTDVALSRAGVPIRLTGERWSHILENHPEMSDHRDQVLETVERPDMILQGGRGELLAASIVVPEKYLVVAYRELARDGFIITAFLTGNAAALRRRTQLWP